MLSPDEDEFLRASEGFADAERARQRRSTRRLKTLTLVSVVAMLAAVSAGVVAVDRGRDAARRRDVAEADRIAAMVAADESLTHAERLFAAIALESRTPTAETAGLLVGTLLTIPAAERSELDIVAVVGDAPAYSTGMAILVLDDNGRPATVDASDLELDHLPVDLRPEVVLARADRRLAVSADSFAVVDSSSGEAVGPPPQLRGEPSAVALSSDGTVLALGYDSPSSAEPVAAADAVPVANDPGSHAFVDLVDVATGVATRRLATASSTIRELEFSVDGRRVMGVVDAVAVELWDVGSGRQLLRIDVDSASPSPVTTSAFGRAGDSLALGRRDGGVELWREQAEGWRPIQSSLEHADAVTWLEFDANDALVVSSSLDGSAIVWQTGDGTRRAGPMWFDTWGSLTSFFAGTTTDVITIDSIGRVWTWPSAPGGALVEILPVTSGAGPPDHLEWWTGVTDGTAVALRDDGPAPLDVGAEVIDVVNGWYGDHAVIFPDHLEWYDDRGELQLTIAGEWDRIGPRVSLSRHSIAYVDPGEPRQIIVRSEDGAVVDEITVPFRVREPAARIDLDPTGTDLLYSTRDGELIWYSLDSFGAEELLPSGRGHDGHFIGEHRAVAVGSQGVQLIDVDGPTPEVVDLGIGRGAQHVAVNDERGLVATAGPNGALTLWDVDSRRPLASPIDVLGAESLRWVTFSGGDRLLVGGHSRTAVIDVGLDVACSVLDGLGEERPSLDVWYVGEDLSDAEVCR